jgi:ABC-2 type transport system permease protein
VVLAAVTAAMAPAVWLTFRRGFDSALVAEIPLVLEWLGRTPVGAGFAAPGFAVEGDWAGVAWRLALMIGTGVVLGLAWRDAVAYSLINPTFRGAGRRRTTDVIAAVTAARSRLGVPTRVVRARVVQYWATDPRYLVSAVGVLVTPAFFYGLVMPILGLDPRWAFAGPILLASSIGWGRHNDVALDSSALWMDVVAGRLGTAVMRGRMAATLVWAVPAVAIAALATLAWTGEWQYTPALVGACIGTLGATLAIASLSSVLFPYRAAAPGKNPFGAEVGSVGASLVAQLVSSAAAVAVLPFATVPLILALTVDARWGGVGLVLGSAIGLLGYRWGVAMSGKAYDSKAGRLLAAVT